MYSPEIRSVEVTRYVRPLREGGSMPAIVEADDGFLYVIKFRGAGQGKRALIAELIGGELARALGLRVPELVFLQLDESFSKTEADEEIQDLLRFSVGLNLGLHYLSGSITFDPVASTTDALTASLVVLLDSLLSNVDRTRRNPNLLNWNRELWLIDHGAALYYHHNWDSWQGHLEKTFPAIKEHVLLHLATELPAAAGRMQERLNPDLFRAVLSLVPDEWLSQEGLEMSPVEQREVYLALLDARLRKIDALVNEAEDARKARL